MKKLRWVLVFSGIVSGAWFSQTQATGLCLQFLKPAPTTVQQKLSSLQAELRQKRKTLETQIFRSFGDISPALDASLYRVFHEPSRIDFKRQALKDLQTSKQTSNMRPSTQIKMLSLIESRAVRPYMALLIGRYIEQVELGHGPFNEKTLENLVQIVNHYIVERALMDTQRSLITHKDQRILELEVMDFLEGRVKYEPYKINYNQPSKRLILSNIVLGHIQKVEDMMARPPWELLYKPLLSPQD